MRRLVVDASVAIKWVVPEPNSAAAAALKSSLLVAPDLIRAEYGNILWRQTKQGLLSADEAIYLFGVLADVPVALTPSERLEMDALSIACELKHPIYDCYYLALAQRENAPLVTEDRRLLQTAQAHGRFRSLVLSLDDASRIQP